MTSTIDTERSPHAGGDAWGPLAEPIHPDGGGPQDPTWKDNAYLSFWDVEGAVYGTFHVSTSPNDPKASRARCSVLLDGEIVEIIEDLPSGSFASESISFGLDGTITVDHPGLTARLGNAPLWVPADYGTNDLIPPLVPGKPLRHFQQACTIRGTFEHVGKTWQVNGAGLRDRTWGFRDEAAQWAEYIGIVGVVDGGFFTAMKFLGMDGGLKAEGYWADDDGSTLITDFTIRRTAAAQWLSSELTLANGSTRTVAMTSRRAGFFVPMGRETDGPAFGTYDDFMTLDSDAGSGAGFCEQGVVHRVY